MTTIIVVALALLVTAALFIPGFPLREKLRGKTTSIWNWLVAVVPAVLLFAAQFVSEFAAVTDFSAYLDDRAMMIWIGFVGVMNVIKQRNKVDKKLEGLD